jgi:hypothetical protein
LNLGDGARGIHPALAGVARVQPELADQLSAGWDAPLAEWSAALWADPPADAGFEAPFRRALVAELAAGAIEPDAAERIVAGVERAGAVLTPHHVCPTDGPTFGAIDWIAAQAAPGPILVLAWSGVPMSNSAASGALCFRRADYAQLLIAGPEQQRQRAAAKDRARDGVTEGRVVLVSPALRDALVYCCPLPDRTREVVAAGSPRLREVVPDPRPGDAFRGGAPPESYSAWAVRCCEAVQRRLTGRDDVWYVDLNQVAARYLAEVLDDGSHPVSRLLDWAEPLGGIDGALGERSWFYARRPGKRESVQTLVGPGAPRAAVRDAVGSGALCPGLVPVFGALRLLSRIRLLGGFRQVAYLEQIAEAWLAAGAVDADQGVRGRLVTGRLTGADGGPLYPLDVVMGAAERSELPAGSEPMSRLWAPLVPRLEKA